MGIDDFVKVNRKFAVAFSGGVDSAYLLWASVEAGADVRAYYVRSQFQPKFEYRDACAVAAKLGMNIVEDGSSDELSADGRPVMKVLKVDVLADPAVRSNPLDRCYYCKVNIMSAITQAAHRDGYDIVCDGTNASDDIDDRPGFRALKEFCVRSPLRECGMTKTMIREASKAAGLEVWNKPAYACLATRIPAGEEITEEKLLITEKAESAMYELGFRDFRVRMRGDAALIQVREEQHDEAVKRLGEITAAIGDLYSSVKIDETVR